MENKPILLISFFPQIPGANSTELAFFFGQGII
jgi:hypothetical protein